MHLLADSFGSLLRLVHNERERDIVSRRSYYTCRYLGFIIEFLE